MDILNLTRIKPSYLFPIPSYHSPNLFLFQSLLLQFSHLGFQAKTKEPFIPYLPTPYHNAAQLKPNPLTSPPKQIPHPTTFHYFHY